MFLFFFGKLMFYRLWKKYKRRNLYKQKPVPVFFSFYKSSFLPWTQFMPKLGNLSCTWPKETLNVFAEPFIQHHVSNLVSAIFISRPY